LYLHHGDAKECQRGSDLQAEHAKLLGIKVLPKYVTISCNRFVIGRNILRTVSIPSFKVSVENYNTICTKLDEWYKSNGLDFSSMHANYCRLTEEYRAILEAHKQIV